MATRKPKNTIETTESFDDVVIDVNADLKEDVTTDVVTLDWGQVAQLQRSPNIKNGDSVSVEGTFLTVEREGLKTVYSIPTPTVADTVYRYLQKMLDRFAEEAQKTAEKPKRIRSSEPKAKPERKTKIMRTVYAGLFDLLTDEDGITPEQGVEYFKSQGAVQSTAYDRWVTFHNIVAAAIDSGVIVGSAEGGKLKIEQETIDE